MHGVPKLLLDGQSVLAFYHGVNIEELFLGNLHNKNNANELAKTQYNAFGRYFIKTRAYSRWSKQIIFSPNSQSRKRGWSFLIRIAWNLNEVFFIRKSRLAENKKGVLWNFLKVKFWRKIEKKTGKEWKLRTVSCTVWCELALVTMFFFQFFPTFLFRLNIKRRPLFRNEKTDCFSILNVETECCLFFFDFITKFYFDEKTPLSWAYNRVLSFESNPFHLRNHCSSRNLWNPLISLIFSKNHLSFFCSKVRISWSVDCEDR